MGEQTTEREALDPTRLTHKQATNRMLDCRDELERLAGKETRTDEDDRNWAELVREVEVLDEHVRNLERAADLDRVRSTVSVTPRNAAPVGRTERATPSGGDYDADPILNPDSVEDRRFRNPWDLSEVRTFSRSKREVGLELRSRALAAVERMPGANDKIRAAATDILEAFDDQDSTIARMALATSSPEYLRAWAKMATNRGHLVTPVEQGALERAMSLTDTAGGYLVPFQLDPTVIITANGSLNQIRQAARQVVATGDVWNGVSAGSVSWSWDAEAAQVSDDTPTFAQPSVPVYKAAGFVPISIEALADEANVTQEVGKLLAFGRDELEATAFITGSGSGQPTGLITALAGGSSEVAAAADDTFGAVDVYTLDDSLPARYRSNASWLAHRKVYNAVRKFDTQGGAQLWERIGAGMPGELLGRRALEAEAMDGVWGGSGASESLILVYGDFSNYVIADRIGMTVEFIPHLFRQTTAGSGFGQPTGQRGWYAYYRVGADSVNDAGFRVLNVTSTA